MIAIRRILCPLDFSRFSRHALEQAVALARETGAEVSVLHVFAFAPVAQTVAAGGSIPMEPLRLEPSARAALQGEIHDFIADLDLEGITLTTTLFEGDPLTRILDRATDWQADLVVMGTHGRSGFERLFLGSVAEKLLRKAPCPVMTVPPRVLSATQGLTFARILCAMDFSPASFRALEYATSLAGAEGPGVIALNVVELFAEGGGMREEAALDTPDFRAELRRAALSRLHDAIPAATRARCPITETVTMGKAWKEILRVAAEHDADVIVLGVAGRSAADLLLFGSTTQHVVRQAACPVLTIRA
jgi:nucleotide-binding universal stress UspA family protein